MGNIYVVYIIINDSPDSFRTTRTMACIAYYPQLHIQDVLRQLLMMKVMKTSQNNKFITVVSSRLVSFAFYLYFLDIVCSKCYQIEPLYHLRYFIYPLMVNNIRIPTHIFRNYRVKHFRKIYLLYSFLFLT